MFLNILWIFFVEKFQPIFDLLNEIYSIILYIYNSKQEEAIIKTLDSCNNRRAQAMKESKTCDCTLSDYVNTKMIYDQEGPKYNKYTRCLRHGKVPIVGFIM